MHTGVTHSLSVGWILGSACGMFGRAPISTPSSHAHVHALTSCGVSARCAQRAPTYQSSVSLCAGRLCWRLRLRFVSRTTRARQPAACLTPSLFSPLPRRPESAPSSSGRAASPPSSPAARGSRLPAAAASRSPTPPWPPPARARARRWARPGRWPRGARLSPARGPREESFREGSVVCHLYLSAASWRELEVLVVRVAAGGVALGRRLHTAQAGQGGALGQPRVEQPEEGRRCESVNRRQNEGGDGEG